MTEQTTCGQGLAAHSELHAKLSKLLATLGKNLELHLTALDPTDEISRPEHDAYTSLMKQHRDLAARLRATADEMASYRNLPMANHDEEALSGQPVIDAFREMLTAQEELQALLEDWTEEYRAMLAEEESDLG